MPRMRLLAAVLLLITPVTAGSRVHANAVFLHADSVCEKEEYRQCLNNVQTQFEACDKDDQRCQCDVMKIIGDECSKYCSDPVNSQYLELFGQQQCDWIEQDVYKDIGEDEEPEEIDPDDCHMDYPGDSVEGVSGANDIDKREGEDDNESDMGDTYEDTESDTYDYDTPSDETDADSAEYPNFADTNYVVDDLSEEMASAWDYDRAAAYADKWANYLEIFRIAPETGYLNLGDTDPMNPGTHPLSELVGGDGDDDDDDDLHDAFDHHPYYQHDNELTFSPEDESKLVRLAKEMLVEAGDDADTVAIWAEAKQRVLAERKQAQETPSEEPSGDTPEVLNGSNLYPIPGSDAMVDGADGADGGTLPGPHSGGRSDWVDGPSLESTFGDPLDVSPGLDKESVLDAPEEEAVSDEMKVEVEPVQPGDVVLDPEATPPVQQVPETESEPEAVLAGEDGWYHSDNDLPVVSDDPLYQPPHSYEPKVELDGDGGVDEDCDPEKDEPVVPVEPETEPEQEHQPETEPEQEHHPEESHPEPHVEPAQQWEPEEPFPEPIQEWTPEAPLPGAGDYQNDQQEQHPVEPIMYEEHHYEEHEEQHHDGNHGQEHNDAHHEGQEHAHINDGQEHHHEHNLEYHEEYHNPEVHHEPEHHPHEEHHPEPEHHDGTFETSDYSQFPPTGDEYDDGPPAPLPEGAYEGYEHGEDEPEKLEGASLAEKLKQLYPNGQGPHLVNQGPDGGNPAYDFDGYDTDSAEVYPGGETPYGTYFGDAFGFSSEAPRLKPLIATLTLGLVVVALFNRDLAPTIGFFLSSLSLGLYIYNHELRF